jgi:type VI secretion system protein VasD
MNNNNKGTRICRWLSFCLVILLAAACAKDEIPPEPTRIAIEIETAGDINPNPEGRPSPLALRIYQLKSSSKFKKADFMSLFENDESVLGNGLLKKEEIFLKSNEKRTVLYEAEADTGSIGLMAIFRNYEQSQWKATTTVIPHKFNQINVSINGTTLTVK